MLININIVQLPVNLIRILLPQFQFEIAFQDQKLFQAQLTACKYKFTPNYYTIVRSIWPSRHLIVCSHAVIYSYLILPKWYVLLINIKREYTIYTVTSLRPCRNRQSAKKLCNRFVKIKFFMIPLSLSKLVKIDEIMEKKLSIRRDSQVIFLLGGSGKTTWIC